MDDRRVLKQALLEEMRRPGYEPLGMGELQHVLRVGKPRRGAFKRAFRDLLDEGAIVRVDRRRFAAAGSPQERAPAGGSARPGRIAPRTRGGAPARKPGASGAPPIRSGGGAVVSGLLQVNPRGFGFVVPDGGGRDLFVPPRGIGDRRDGDRVEARVVRELADGRLQGEIQRVLERSRRKIVGVFRSADRGGVVEAWDRRFEGGIVIPAAEIGGAVNGLVVGVELVHAAEDGRAALGRVVEVLGPQEAPETDLRAVITKYGLREAFAPDVLEQAGQAPAAVTPANLAGREDFRGLPIVTIDGETAMDFDDAVLARRNEDGTWELQVHIADVAHYVHSSTPLDREAFERATSVYFPGTCLPMLPHRLSNGICSLNPGVDRLVLSCLMTIDGHGHVVSYRLVEGVIKSAARMTYTNVAKILVDRDPVVSVHYRDLVPHFRLMEELCGILNARRRRRGSIDFDLPEPEVILAATGEMTGILALERNIAHRIIEEFMLAANETVARHLSNAGVPSIYRVHERPDPRRLEEFDATAQAFGYLLPRPFVSIAPGAFQALLDRARGRPEERFLATLMLRSMKQARYTEKRDIHFGLASSCYTHFTSPIRRYPDLVVHRLVKRLLSGGPLAPGERGVLEAFVPEAAARSSFRERAADAAENELIERKKMAYMAERVGEEYEGFICGVERFGLFVELRELFVEGLVPIETLPGDRFLFVERRRLLQGERHGQVLALGDPVRVRVDRVSQARLEIDFALLEARPGPRPAGTAPPARPPIDRRAKRRAGERRSKGDRARGSAGRRAGGAGGRDRAGGDGGATRSGRRAGRQGRRRR
jgi:ribonuclease R